MRFTRRLVSLLLGLSVFAVASVNSSWYMTSAYDKSAEELKAILGKEVDVTVAADASECVAFARQLCTIYSTRKYPDNCPDATKKTIDEYFEANGKAQTGKKDAILEKYETILYGGSEFIVNCVFLIKGNQGEERYLLRFSKRDGRLQVPNISDYLQSLVASNFEDEGDEYT